MFLPKKDLVTISLIVILFFLNKGTRWTLGVEQNTILLLLMLIFIWKDEESPRVGIWLAFGIIIKPIFAIILGYIAIKKNWKGLLVTFLIVSLLFITAGLVFGSDVLYSYFNKNPNTDVPNVNYLEIVNCSLLATVLRVTNYDISIHPPLFNPLFLIISGIILIVSFLIIYINRNDSERWGLAYITVTGLLVYPATQQFYTILLIPFVFLLYKNIERLPGNIFSTAIIITFIYAFPQIDSNNIDVYFITHIIIWLILSAFLVAKSKRLSKIVMKLKTAQFNI